MIKEVFYETGNGEKGSLLARESIVKGSFKNNYSSYLKERLGREDIKVIKNIPYKVKNAVNNSPVEPKEKEMYIKEQEMVMKNGVKTVLLLGEKRNKGKIVK